MTMSKKVYDIIDPTIHASPISLHHEVFLCLEKQYPVTYNALSLESKNKQIQIISSLFQIL